MLSKVNKTIASLLTRRIARTGQLSIAPEAGLFIEGK